MISVLIVSAGCENRHLPEKRSSYSLFAGVSDISYDGYTPGVRSGRFLSAFAPEHPGSMDPAEADDPVSAHLTRLLFASLVRRNQMTMEWEPWMAERWTVLDGGRRINFQLREGLRWSDGEPVVAADWEFVTMLALERRVPRSYAGRFQLRGGFARFTAVDNRTVALELPAVHSAAFRIAGIPPLPAHALRAGASAGSEAFDDSWEDRSIFLTIPVTGPFTFSGSLEDGSLLMKANPGYFETDSDGALLPYIDEYLMLPAADAEARTAMLHTGKIDHCIVSNEDVAEAVSLKRKIGVVLYDAGPAAQTHVLAFNRNPDSLTPVSGIEEHELAWLENRDFRRALAHLVDREAIIREVASGFGYPQVSFVPQGSPYYRSGTEAAAPRFDPEAARKLLHNAGFRDRNGDGIREDPEGNTVQLVLRTNEENQERIAISNRVADDARAAGIRIVCHFEPFHKLVTRLVSSYDWELVLMGQNIDIDPTVSPVSHIGYGWEAETAAAWQDAASTVDEAAKRLALEGIQRRWIRETPWVYTFASAVVHACKARWENFCPRSAPGYGLCAILPRIYERGQQ